MRIPDSDGRTGPNHFESSALPKVRSLTFTAKRFGLNRPATLQRNFEPVRKQVEAGKPHRGGGPDSVGR